MRRSNDWRKVLAENLEGRVRHPHMREFVRQAEAFLRKYGYRPTAASARRRCLESGDE